MVAALPFAALLFLGVVALVTAPCPGGWERHGQSCYLFRNETFNWFDAKATCETMGSRLVEIETAAENTFLATFVAQHGDHHPWIGLEDFAEEGIFVWVSTREVPEQTFWGTGEPEDKFHHEDCGGMTGAGQWFDGTCDTDRRPMMCEKEVHDTPIMENDWHDSTNNIQPL